MFIEQLANVVARLRDILLVGPPNRGLSNRVALPLLLESIRISHITRIHDEPAVGRGMRRGGELSSCVDLGVFSASIWPWLTACIVLLTTSATAIPLFPATLDPLPCLGAGGTWTSSVPERGISSSRTVSRRTTRLPFWAVAVLGFLVTRSAIIPGR